ncbi:unnamed protein product [Urochloa humidicola]
MHKIMQASKMWLYIRDMEEIAARDPVARLLRGGLVVQDTPVVSRDGCSSSWSRDATSCVACSCLLLPVLVREEINLSSLSSHSQPPEIIDASCDHANKPR